MPRIRNFIGEDTVDRLTERDALRRISLPGGKEAFTGPAATRALQAMDGEAMTVDKSIIVAEDFDPSNAEDMALYAHELYHVEEGRDGELTHAIHDAEEVAARAVESMVFHRMSGGYEGGYQPGAGKGPVDSAGTATPDHAGRGEAPFGGAPNQRPASVDTSPDPIRGYHTLKKQGLSHMDIVEKMAKDILSAMDDAKFQQTNRFSDLKGNFSR